MTKHTGYRWMIVFILLFFLSSPAFAQSNPPSKPITLDEAVSLVLQNSDLIRQAAEAMAAQEAVEKSARADLFPPFPPGINIPV